MGEELRAHPFVLGQNQVRTAQSLGRAGCEIAEIPDRSRDYVKTRREALFIHVRSSIAPKSHNLQQGADLA
jgi:hypothetical protein